ADIMKASCVNCHNTHPDSPKTDWQIGDVRGIIEITQSLDSVTDMVNLELQGMSLFLTSIFLLILLGLFLVVSRLCQTSKELELKVSERTRDLAEEREKSEKLLQNILPQKIVQNLKDSQDSLAEHFTQVTILFADIVGFTALSAQLHPLELVDQLNQIFSTFDRLAEQYGLEKIKTIGDAYMVVGGLPVSRTDHAEAIANIALEMQKAIGQFRTNNDRLLKIRIGINTGAVVAGVIGKQKFAYDLWGDAVNVASRMESTGEPDRIQVTKETYKLLKNRYDLERRGEIEVKGKGKMVTYWLLGKKY
ncbi:MAG: adenylate/guanylate cyclase domain-containing protein, partial [Cyanobacteria bacterium P01_E01_bin.42]